MPLVYDIMKKIGKIFERGECSVLQEFLAELRKTKVLEPEKEAALWQRAAAGDMEAHHLLMISYQPLVFKLAMGFHLDEPQTMELIQEGTVGLLEAAENFNHSRGVAFSLFAAHRIKGSMIDFLKKNSAAGHLSLEKELDNGLTLRQMLAAEAATPTEVAERHMLEHQVASAMARLPFKEQAVLRGIFVEDRSAQAVADGLNVSLGHVYRLQKRGVRRVRGMLSRFMHELKG